MCLKPHHLEKAMAPHSSTLAWKILWTEEPGRLQSMGSLKSRARLSDFHFSLSCIGEGNGNPSSVLAWRIPGTGEPGGLLSIGLHRVGHDWSNLAAMVNDVCCCCSLPGSSVRGIFQAGVLESGAIAFSNDGV